MLAEDTTSPVERFHSFQDIWEKQLQKDKGVTSFLIEARGQNSSGQTVVEFFVVKRSSTDVLCYPCHSSKSSRLDPGYRYLVD